MNRYASGITDKGELMNHTLVLASEMNGFSIEEAKAHYKEGEEKNKELLDLVVMIKGLNREDIKLELYQVDITKIS